MGSNASMVGKSYPARDKHLDRVSVEAFADATSDENPRYRGERAAAPPMMVVSASIPNGVLPPLLDQEFFGDPSRLLRLLHGDEEITWHRLIHAGDTLTTVGTIERVEEKSSGELVVIGTRLTNQRGELVAETRSGLVIREKKPTSLKVAKEEVGRADEPPAALSLSVEWKIAADQSVRYAEVSGDHNPIHLDDDVARSAGLKGRILHGLCTMAFAQRCVVDRLAGGDPARLRRLRVRFSKPVYMDDTLTCIAWEVDRRATGATYGLLVRNQDGVLVLRDAVAEVAN